MGGCVGSPGGGRRGSGSASAFSESSLAGHATKNKPLNADKQVRWKSDIPLSLGQLEAKREEFWDTAPAFEGKAEIWAALRAAVEAWLREDVPMAQAILDGAGVSLPGGSLSECYDELGSRYSIPVYCLSFPLNLLPQEDRTDSPADFSEPLQGGTESPATGQDLKVKIRVSATGEDARLVVNTLETVGMAKRKLADQEGVGEPASQRWYFGGKMLGDKMAMGDTGVPQGYVIQCVVNTIDFDVIPSQ